MLKHARRATIALTTSAILTTGLVSGPARAASPESDAATSWLVGQLQDGVLQSQYGPQYGPSLDVFFALAELETEPAAQQSILDAVEANVPEQFSYVGSGGESYAGPIGKLLTAVQTAGVDPATFAEGDLLARLRALVSNERDNQFGRAMDDSQYGDYSSTITQAWAVRAFAGAGHKFVGRTTSYLLKQQCDDGFFRESLKGRSCEAGVSKGNSAPSVDATALAVMALQAARGSGVTDLGDDIRDALRWLANRQKDNGAFVGNGVPNANSTGLAAWVLADTRWDAAAADAERWVRKLQVTEANSDGTALASEIGAVAYDRASFNEGVEDGITQTTAIEWALATAQSAVALNL